MTHDDDAVVVPLAQRQVIDLFYRGIFPKLEDSIPGLVLRCLGEIFGPLGKRSTAKLTEKFEEAFKKILDEKIEEECINPLTAAVSALPRYELAKLAEALVNLTAFRAHMAADQDETVGGPIDVAVISKGDGFVWVKRKNLVRGDVFHSDTLL